MNIFKYPGLLFCIIILSGCFSMKHSSELLERPYGLSNERDLSSIIVAVEYKGSNGIFDSSILEDLAKKLRKANIFKNVYYADDVSILSTIPDLILHEHIRRDERPLGKDCSLGFEGEMITIGTLGIIPQVCEGYQTDYFTLSRPGSDSTLEIPMKYRYGHVMGWAAIFYSLSPEWTLSHKDHDAKYTENLKAVFLSKAKEIQRLVD